MLKFKIMLKNIILKAVISLINDDGTFQVTLFDKVKNIANTNFYGLKTFAIKGSNVLLFNPSGNGDSTVGFAVSKALDLPALEEGEIAIYNELTSNYVHLKSDGSINVYADKVYLNGNTEAILKGTTFLTLFNAHTHTSAAPASPTSTPIVPLPSSVLSTKNFTE